VLTNYRPGVLERLGIGFEDLEEASIPKSFIGQGSSWGSDWPLEDASEPRYARASRQRQLWRKAALRKNPPLPAPIFLADHSGALSLAAGILAAVVRTAIRTGEPQRVDASILRHQWIAMQGMEINYTSITDQEPERRAVDINSYMGCGVLFLPKTANICIAGVDDKRWPAFCKITHIEHLQNDPEYGDNVTRIFMATRSRLCSIKIFPTKTSKEWLAETQRSPTCSRPRSSIITTCSKSEQARINGYLLELRSSGDRKVLISGQPVTINGEVPTQAEMPPEHGHAYGGNSAEAGYSWEDIARLQESGAV